MGIPTTPILILRFPDGDVEYRSTRGELPTGALVRSRGSMWRVRAYDGETAFLDPLDETAGAGGGPVMNPSPLGDEPLTLEVLAEV